MFEDDEICLFRGLVNFQWQPGKLLNFQEVSRVSRHFTEVVPESKYI